MKELKVKIWDVHNYTCINCCTINRELTEVIYEDELEYNAKVQSLFNALNITHLLNNAVTCITIYKNITVAFKELLKNIDAYKKYKQEIEAVKIFLWGIKLTIEDYPEGQLQFFTKNLNEDEK